MKHGETKFLLKCERCGGDIGRLLNNRNDLINVVERLRETEEDMLALLGLPQVVFGAELHHLSAVLHEVLQHAREGEHLRHAADKREHVVVEGAFKFGVFIQIIQNGLRMRRAFELHDDANIRSGFIAQVADALNFLLLHQVCDTRDKLALVHAIRNRSNDDARIFLPVVNNLRLAAHHYRPLARAVRVRDVRLAESDAAEREIRTLHEFQEVISRGVWVINKVDGRGDYFAEIVRRNVGRHAHRDAERAVQKQVRERGGKHSWLIACRIVIRVPRDGLFFQIGEERLGDA